MVEFLRKRFVYCGGDSGDAERKVKMFELLRSVSFKKFKNIESSEFEAYRVFVVCAVLCVDQMNLLYKRNKDVLGTHVLFADKEVFVDEQRVIFHNKESILGFHESPKEKNEEKHSRFIDEKRLEEEKKRLLSSTESLFQRKSLENKKYIVVKTESQEDNKLNIKIIRVQDDENLQNEAPVFSAREEETVRQLSRSITDFSGNSFLNGNFLRNGTEFVLESMNFSGINKAFMEIKKKSKEEETTWTLWEREQRRFEEEILN